MSLSFCEGMNASLKHVHAWLDAKPSRSILLHGVRCILYTSIHLLRGKWSCILKRGRFHVIHQVTCELDVGSFIGEQVDQIINALWRQIIYHLGGTQHALLLFLWTVSPRVGMIHKHFTWFLRIRERFFLFCYRHFWVDIRGRMCMFLSLEARAIPFHIRGEFCKVAWQGNWTNCHLTGVREIWQSSTTGLRLTHRCELHWGTCTPYARFECRSNASSPRLAFTL